MKEICLGTAMWGWSVLKRQALLILDSYYDNGGRYIDTAYNYPLNNDESCILRASKYINEWLNVNKVSDLKVFYKFGSIHNRNCPKNDLSPESIIKNTEEAKELFGDNLHLMMIHWDNRNDSNEITESIQCLRSVSDNNLIGISGIKYPLVYSNVIQTLETIEIDIQVKSNFITRGESKYKSFNQFHPKFWAYGISSSGLKLDISKYRANSYVSLTRGRDYHQEILDDDKIAMLKNVIDSHHELNSLYDFAIAYSEMNELLYGYLVSPSREAQMESIIKTRKDLNDNKINIEFVLS